MNLPELPWNWIVGLGSTGILMALLSSLVGMRAKVENPAWWALYSIWVVLILQFEVSPTFLTILMASVLAGLLHATTQSLLIEQYKKNNPWYADKMTGPVSKIRMMFMLMGLGIGVAFGGLVGGIAWGIQRFLFA